MDVIQYFNIFNKLWQEIDMFDDCVLSSAEDGERYKKMVDKEQIFDFLAGLNKELDEVWGRVLGTKLLSSIDEIFAEVRREECRKCVMLEEQKPLPTLDNLVLAVRGSNSAYKGDSHSNQRGNRLWCGHCQCPIIPATLVGKIHGKPANWKKKVNKSDPNGYHTAAEPSPKPNNSNASVSLTKEQMEQLYKLLTPTSLPNNLSTSPLAQKGTFSFALNGVTQREESWIINSGATNNMTRCSNLFSTYTSSLGNFKVKIADGSLTIRCKECLP